VTTQYSHVLEGGRLKIKAIHAGSKKKKKKNLKKNKFLNN